MKKTALTAAILLTLAACGSEAEMGPTPAPIDDIEPIDVRDAYDDEIAEAVDVSLDSSIELLRQGSDPNRIISPASLTSALAIAGEGAQCETQTEINAFLGVDDDARTSVYTQLTESMSTSGDEYVTDFQSAIVDNADSDSADEEKLKSVAASYGSDYLSASPDVLMDQLNAWVEEATGGRQTELPSPLDDTTEAAFITTLRYETEWRKEPTETSYGFTTLEGETVEVKGYGMQGRLTGWEVDRGTIIELPAASPDKTYIYYPDEVMDPTELTAADWDRQDAEEIDVHLSVPGLDLEAATDVIEHKDAIGLPHLTDMRAGCGLALYSAVDNTLAIDVVIQNATFTLDDKGIAATAVTEITAVDGAAPDQEEPVTIAVDRPYAMLTVDADTGWALMYVTVTDPTLSPVQG